jgi:hypothetical protein
MKAGLYSRETVAAWLGKRPTEINRMVEEDGLPAVKLGSALKVRYKFSAAQLQRWLNARSNVHWTVAELHDELSRVQASGDALEGRAAA